MPPDDSFFDEGPELATPPMTNAAPIDFAKPKTPSGEDHETRTVHTVASVLERWGDEGPLAHEPTGLVELDERTGGGPVYGTRWYIVGAPDAGKTGLLLQLADVFARRGICVGLLAIDEEPGDLVIRLGQRAGFSRSELEGRTAETLGFVRETLADLPIRFYGGEHSIESAAQDLATWAAERGVGAMLGIDSIQSVTCSANLDAGGDGRAPSVRELVSANVQAVRNVASAHRLIAIATSEMNRTAYRHKKSADESNDIAAGAESRAIEFSARVLLALRSVPGESDLAEVRLAKNKHGPGWRGEADSIFLRLDRPGMTFALTEAPDGPSKEDERTKNVAKVETDALAVLAIIVQTPGMGKRALRAKVSVAGLKMGVPRLDAAVLRLSDTNRLENRATKRGKVEYAHYHAIASDEGPRVR
jgi:hypothetical protein